MKLKFVLISELRFLRSIFLTFFITPVLMVSSHVYAKDYMIYSIEHELDMGSTTSNAATASTTASATASAIASATPEVAPKKNYYINIGQSQGIKKGTVLEVFRVVTKVSPFEKNKRYQHKFKIGELEVIHSDTEAAISKFKTAKFNEEVPVIELNGYLVGDLVGVKL